jgi:FkbH-like protein
VFDPTPSRLAVLNLQPPWPLDVAVVTVRRNHAFEHVGTLVQQFAAFAGFNVSFQLSAYDDSLTWNDPAAKSLIELVWLDYDRYTSTRWTTRYMKAVERLREATDAAILVHDWPHEHDPDGTINQAVERAAQLPGVHVMRLSAVSAILGARFFDDRLAGPAGTRLSGAAHLAIAQSLGLSWIPALAGRRIKAVLVDLDETLIGGVLGEDGIREIRVTPDHAALHRALTDLHHRGIFLGIVSRNEPNDVQALFEARAELHTLRQAVDYFAVSWDPKSHAVAAAAERWTIGIDSIVMIDDNIGELAEISARFPEVALLHARSPADTTSALQLFPGLLREVHAREDGLRHADLRAATERSARRQKAADINEYLATLDIEIDISVNNADHLERLHELSMKTNQFNTRLSRLSAAAVQRYERTPSHAAVSVALRDNLSDSGIIAGLFVHAADGVLTVDEIDISCRALGRGLESPIIAEVLRKIMEDWGLSRAMIPLVRGPRNGPVLSWAEGFGGALGSTDLVDIDFEFAVSKAKGYPVTIRWIA